MLNQDPAGGSKVKANVPVVLTVSGTQTSVTVPSVLGQSPASAGATLSQAGLNVGSQTSACSSQFSSGLVSAQNPVAGADIPPNTSVNLVISSGSCATVPSVVGQSESAATVGHHRRGPGRQHDLRHDLCRRGHAGERRQPRTRLPTRRSPAGAR